MDSTREELSKLLFNKYQELKGPFFKYSSTSRNLHDTAHSYFCNCCGIPLSEGYRGIQTPFVLYDDGSENSTDRDYSCDVCGYKESRYFRYGEKYGQYSDATFGTLKKYTGTDEVKLLFCKPEELEEKKGIHMVEDSDGNLYWMGNKEEMNYYFRVALVSDDDRAQVVLYNDDDKRSCFLVSLTSFDEFAKRHNLFVPKPGVYESLMDVTKRLREIDELRSQLDDE